MKLLVYKGFDVEFLNNIREEKLFENSIKDKFNVLLFDNKYKKSLEINLLGMEEEDAKWVTYEEFILINNSISNSIEEYSLNVEIIVNNMFPDCYPVLFEVDDDLKNKILEHNEFKIIEDSRIKSIFKIYSEIMFVQDKIFGTFMNYEYDGQIRVTKYYEYNDVELYDENVDTFEISINNDLESYLKFFIQLNNGQNKKVSYTYTKGLISDRIKEALKVYCTLNSIDIITYSNDLKRKPDLYNELINIAKDEICIPNFEDFRELVFYENPLLGNTTTQISQGQIIKELIIQAEKRYNDEINARDIFITASTGAGKSVMFQIPAVYLAKKYNKLTIIIEPVKALMQDQKEQLVKRGYNRVETFNSDLITQIEKEKVLQRIKNGEVDLLYLSPETLLSYSIETIIGDRDIGLIIIDEAHIVTTWGIGFRPDYWYLGSYINKLRNVYKYGKKNVRKIFKFPICAFTATAVNGGEDDTIKETIESLYMENTIEYIGFARRDDINFDINVINREKISQKDYQAEKVKYLNTLLQTNIDNNEKTIVYFPYASTAQYAYDGNDSFTDVLVNKEKIGIYTGSSKMSAILHNQLKKDSFEKFRNGTKNIMYATKAFGMGVDINDIKYVYHYAPTGNLCDYVQEIGRAARKKEIIGVAKCDFFINDMNYIEQLFGMSQIKSYQLMKVLKDIYEVYCNKKTNSFLISPNSFTYIFQTKKGNHGSNEEDYINKLKTCLLMIERDFYEKFNHKALISRPQSVFTKAFIVIKDESKDDILSSKYGKYMKYVQAKRVASSKENGDVGDVYELNLKALWEDLYSNLSFPEFKYKYFNSKKISKKNNKDEKIIMREIIENIYPRQKITVETKENIALDSLKELLFNEYDYVVDLMYDKFGRNKFFTTNELIKELTFKYGKTKAQVIGNSLFDIVDPEGAVVGTRLINDEMCYSLKTSTLRRNISDIIKKATIVRLFEQNSTTKLICYTQNDDNTNLLFLKLLSIFDFVNYEIVGGSEPEIFIRLNNPELVKRITRGTVRYSNNYIKRARDKHDRDVKVMKKFFLELKTDLDRWNYIENYFLGNDVLFENTIISYSDNNLIIDDANSYSYKNFTWDDIANDCEEKHKEILLELKNNNISTPEYGFTAFVDNKFKSEVLMTWPKEKIIVFDEDVLESDLKLCGSYGWKAYSIIELTPDKIYGGD